MKKGLKELLNAMKDGIFGGDNDDKKVVLSLPVKKEWQKSLDALKDVKEEGYKQTMKLKKLKRKAELLGDAFWSQVRLSTPALEEYNHLRYNKDTNEIEALENDENDCDGDCENCED